MFKSYKIAIAGLFVIGVVLIAYGLVNQFRDPVRRELEHYLKDQIGDLAPLEEKAINAYHRFEEARNEDKLKAALEDYILPNYESFKDGIQEIQPELEELADLHETLSAAVEAVYKGLSLRLDSLEQGDNQLRTRARDKISEGNRLRNEWRTALKSLADRHGVTFY